MHSLLNIRDLNLNIANRHIIKNVSLELKNGDFAVLLGSNGSGKSSLLKLINRLHLPDSGSISLSGRVISCYSKQAYAKRVLTIAQSPADNLFLNMSILENARLYLGQIKKHILQEYLRTFNVNLASGIDVPVNVLSGGEQQILVLALCLKLQPDLLLLDEHTSGLDPQTAEKIIQVTADFIAQQNVTCIMTTHNLQHAEQCGNRLFAINNGSLICDAGEIKKQQFNVDYLLTNFYRKKHAV